MIPESPNSSSNKRTRCSIGGGNTSFQIRSPTFSSHTTVSEPDRNYSSTAMNSIATLPSAKHCYPTSSDPIQFLLPSSVFGTGYNIPQSSHPIQQTPHSFLQARKVTQLAPSVNSIQASTLDSKRLIPVLPLDVGPEVTKRRRGKKGKKTPGRRISANSTLRCEICNQMYSRKDNLRAHQRVHNGERPYKCKQCGESFRWLGALRTHQATHRKECDQKPHDAVVGKRTCPSAEEERQLPQGGTFEGPATENAFSERKSSSGCTLLENTMIAKNNIPNISGIAQERIPEIRGSTTSPQKVMSTCTESDQSVGLPCAILAESNSPMEEFLVWEKCEEFVLSDNFLLETPLLPELSSDWLPIQAA